LISELENEISQKKFALSVFWNDEDASLKVHDPNYISNPQFRASVDKALALQGAIRGREISISHLKVKLQEKLSFALPAQMDNGEDSSGAISHLKTDQVFRDDMGDSEEMKHPSTDVPRFMSSLKEDPNKFLERPILIATFALPLSGNTVYIVDPIKAFFADSSVRAHIRNFGFITFDFVVTVEVSATMFHYGRLLLAMVPNTPRNPVYNEYAINPLRRENKLRYLSQTPGAQTLDVRLNKPASVKMPLVGPAPVARLFNNSVSTITTGVDFDDLVGRLTFTLDNLTPIRCASQTPSEPFVFIRAHCENVKLGCSTGTLMDVPAQCEEVPAQMADERETGPVTRVSSALIPISRALESVPWMAPFARASTMILSGINHVSAYLGFSVPIMNHEPTRVKSQPFINGALAVGYSTADRVGLDPKGELTVDGRCAGVDCDEMQISHLCAKEGLLTRFSLNNSTGVNTPIIKFAVNPRMGVEESTGVVQPTPMAWISALFAYWSGTIKFRFDFVKCNFHKGKIKFDFEPNITGEAAMVYGTGFNKRFSFVVDLQETDSITLCVKPTYHKQWLRVPSINSATNSIVVGNGPIVNTAEKWRDSIGVLTVSMLTKFQTPDLDDMDILVFVSSDDIVFNRLTVANLPSRVFPSSGFFVDGELVSEDVKEDDVDVPAQMEMDSNNINSQEVSCIELNPAPMSDIGKFDWYFGEQIQSLRYLLKRFVTTVARNPGNIASGSKLLTLSAPILPTLDASFAYKTPDGPVLSVFDYIRRAYMCCSGSVRKRFYLTGFDNAARTDSVRVSLNRPETVQVAPTFTGALGNQDVFSFVDGTVSYVLGTNTGMEVEFPFYTNNTFCYPCNPDPQPSGDVMMDPLTSRNYTLTYGTNYATTTNTRIIVETAYGEDFNLYRFIAAPPYEA
jgi:hypothetical protein